MANPITSAKSAIQNAFIGKLLEHLLDGNKGSNVLGAILTAILAAHVDYSKALKGFKFDDMDASMESAKLAGAVVLAVFAYFVGRKKVETPAK
jgi:hypothetical protein